MKCRDCNGTGRDTVKTAQLIVAGVMRKGEGYVRCWTCNGNGAEPVYPSSFVKDPTCVLCDAGEVHEH